VNILTRKPLHFLILFCIAAALRLPRLSSRPMHTDEAVHGIKLGQMIERNYQYDSSEYHGPTLNLFTIPVAWLAGQRTLVQITENTLRLVPVIFSLLTLWLLFGLQKGLGDGPVWIAGLLFSISPVFVFYSRYYIQETLLVCFSTGMLVSALHWIKQPTLLSSVLLGFFLGLMQATKETWILSVFALFITVFLLNRNQSAVKSIGPKLLIIAFMTMTATSLLFTSVFLTDLHGFTDSWLSLIHYIRRAGGDGHYHPWFFYIHRLFFYRGTSGFISSEILILVMAMIGIWANYRKPADSQPYFRYILGYSLLLTLIYGVIPYKTPWLVLNFWIGWIIMAGSGVYVLIRLSAGTWYKLFIAIILAAGCVHLTGQSIVATSRYESSPDNPWIYAHPDRSIQRIEQVIRKLPSTDSEGNPIFIEIIYPGHEYWPLPWMLRDLSRIIWTDHADFSSVMPDVIFLAPEMQNSLAEKIYAVRPRLYRPLFTEPVPLRPGALMQGFASLEIWEKINE
jgi:uncharacterized protein (TIGR03663 family)